MRTVREAVVFGIPDRRATIGQIGADDGMSGFGAMEQVDLEYARRPDGTLRVALGGDWRLAHGIPAPRGIIEEIEKSPLPKKVIFETGILGGWDSGLLTFLMAVLSRCTQLGGEADRPGLPEGIKRLLALPTAGPATPRRPRPEPEPGLPRVGGAAMARLIWRGDTPRFIC